MKNCTRVVWFSSFNENVDINKSMISLGGRYHIYQIKGRGNVKLCNKEMYIEKNYSGVRFTCIGCTLQQSEDMPVVKEIL